MAIVTADEKNVEGTHGRETGADDADGVFYHRPNGWVHVSPGGVFVREALDDDGAVGTCYADAVEEIWR